MAIDGGAVGAPPLAVDGSSAGLVLSDDDQALLIESQAKLARLREAHAAAQARREEDERRAIAAGAKPYLRAPPLVPAPVTVIHREDP